MYYYAELNENDICVAVYESLDPIDDPSYIEIDSLDDSYTGRHYDRATGTWGEAGFAQTAAHSTDEINYRVVQLKPRTSAENVEGAVKSINGATPDSTGDVAVKDYLTSITIRGPVITYVRKDGTRGIYRG